MALLKLPNELILCIADNVLCARDINNMARTCRHFYALLNEYLYMRDFKESACEALDWAAEHGKPETAKIILRILHSMCKHRTVLSYIRESLCTAIEYNKLEMVELFLQTDCLNFNKRCRDGQSPLYIAAVLGQTRIAERLLATGKVHYNTRSLEYCTPLHAVADGGYPEIAKLLLSKRKIKVNEKDKNGDTPCHIAASHGFTGTVKILLNSDKVDLEAMNNKNLTPLEVASRNGHAKVAELLFAASREHCQTSARGTTTLLHWAISRNQSRLLKALLKREKVDVSGPDANGNTPLHLAARQNYQSFIRNLVSSGRLHPACFDKPLDTIEEEPKGDPLGIRDPEGKFETPMYVAARNGYHDAVKALMPDKSVRVTKCSDTVRYRMGQLHQVPIEGGLDRMKSLVARGQNPKREDSEGWTPLSHAAQVGNCDIVEFLIGLEGIDVNQKDGNGNTPLSLAAQWGHVSVVQLLLSLSGVDANVKDRNGLTPLARAAIWNRVDVVGIMLQDAKVCAGPVDNKGYTPQMWAEFYGHSHVDSILRRYESWMETIVSIAAYVAKRDSELLGEDRKSSISCSDPIYPYQYAVCIFLLSSLLYIIFNRIW